MSRRHEPAATGILEISAAPAASSRTYSMTPCHTNSLLASAPELARHCTRGVGSRHVTSIIWSARSGCLPSGSGTGLSTGKCAACVSWKHYSADPPKRDRIATVASPRSPTSAWFLRCIRRCALVATCRPCRPFSAFTITVWAIRRSSGQHRTTNPIFRGHHRCEPRAACQVIAGME